MGSAAAYSLLSIYIGSKYASHIYQYSPKYVPSKNTAMDDAIISSVFYKTGAILGAFFGGTGVAVCWPLIAAWDNLENQAKLQQLQH